MRWRLSLLTLSLLWFAAPAHGQGANVVAAHGSVHNIQITRELEFSGLGEVQLYGAARNLFDYVQPSPLIDPANPFGDAFDTTYVYGPIRGRNFGFGARLILLRSRR